MKKATSTICAPSWATTSRSRPPAKASFRSRTARSSPGSPGVTIRCRKAKRPLAVANLSWPGHPRTEFSSWSRTRKNSPRPAAGGSLNSTTVNPPARRCTTPAFPATRSSRLATSSSTVTHRDTESHKAANVPKPTSVGMTSSNQDRLWRRVGANARRLFQAIDRDDVEFRVFLADLERGLKIGRVVPSLQRLHAVPAKDHNRPVRQVSRNLRSRSCRDILAAVILDRFLRRRNVLFCVALLVADLVDGDHVNRRLGLRMQSLDRSATKRCPRQH